MHSCLLASQQKRALRRCLFSVGWMELHDRRAPNLKNHSTVTLPQVLGEVMQQQQLSRKMASANVVIPAKGELKIPPMPCIDGTLLREKALRQTPNATPLQMNPSYKHRVQPKAAKHTVCSFRYFYLVMNFLFFFLRSLSFIHAVFLRALGLDHSSFPGSHDQRNGNNLYEQHRR